MKIISYLIFIFYFNIIQAAMPAFDASLEQSYGKGSLPGTVGHPSNMESSVVRLDDQRLIATGGLTLSCGIPSFLNLPLLTVPTRVTLEPFMSSVKNQGDLGTCTAFAIIACLEFLEQGRVFSETELYIRLKTKGGDDRTVESSNLRMYNSLLREGVVESRFFMSYKIYQEYVKRRKFIIFSPNGRLCPAIYLVSYSRNRYPIVEGGDKGLVAMSDTYSDSIQEFKDWCFDNYDSTMLPNTIKPSWRVERAWLNSSFLCHTTIDRDYVFTEAESYYGRFTCIPIESRNVALLKRILASRTPIAIGVWTFVRKEKAIDKDKRIVEKVVEDYWWNHIVTRNKFVIDLPPSDAQEDGGHAICLCGYDDSAADGIGAFRFKNSWGNWGDHGYAWITYRYIERHAQEESAVKINK